MSLQVFLSVILDDTYVGHVIFHTRKRDEGELYGPKKHSFENIAY